MVISLNGKWKNGAHIGHTGVSIYGELGDNSGMTGRIQTNEINYFATVDFCNELDLTIEEFEKR